ncbi:hypothetical protein BH23PLA1_BH23PLA1_34450 [soil metagenome]
MSSVPHEHLRVEVVEGVTIVHFLDRELTEPYESYEAREVGQQLYSLVEDGGYPRLLVSLRDVEYISTYILGKLVGLKRKVEAVGGQLQLCELKAPLVRESFQVTGLDRIFKIHDEESTAIEAFSAR